VNYFIAEDDITVEDSNNILGIYDDANTAGGYVIQVRIDESHNMSSPIGVN
jgi:hypothetical protein